MSAIVDNKTKHLLIISNNYSVSFKVCFYYDGTNSSPNLGSNENLVEELAPTYIILLYTQNKSTLVLPTTVHVVNPYLD